MTPDAQPVVGVLLAGGLARRMGGGDKCLCDLKGRPILAHVIARARPQVDCLVINANGDPGRFAPFGLPIVADSLGPYAGPLAGILAGLEWARDHLGVGAWVASFAADTPYFPIDWVARVRAAIAAAGADLGCCASGERSHPVFGLWPVRLAAALRQAMAAETVRKIDAWTARYHLVTVRFDIDPAGGDPFFNINAPADLAMARGVAG
jgi:molybdopterin-guanine dinucleotide biosynthesis protein A